MKKESTKHMEIVLMHFWDMQILHVLMHSKY